MLSEEEKKAIKDCDVIFIMLEDMMSEDSANDYRKSYLKLKNLLEIQQKEIEVLKDTNKKLYETGKLNAIQELINNNYISKDKIREKIEKYKKEKELYDKDEDREWGQYNNWDWVDSFINELQSLLKEE